MKKVIRCGSILIAASLLAGAYKNEIMCAAKKAEKLIEKNMQRCKKKPSIVLLYDSTPCNCTSICEECDDGCTPEDDCICCTDIECYKTLFAKYKCCADAAYIDTAKVCPSEYIERFGIKCVPTVMLLTADNNLIAMLEKPEDISDVECMIAEGLKHGGRCCC